MIVRGEPHVDAAPAEAARHRKAAVGSAKDQRAGNRTRRWFGWGLAGTGTRNFEVASDRRGSKFDPGGRDKLTHRYVPRKFAVPCKGARIAN
jgi:hypothetical protein